MVSKGPTYTLVQSPTLMNISGPFVQRAWQEMVKEHDASKVGLVIVHDELEKDFGVVHMLPWDRSPRGHNGVKSVKNSLSQSQYPSSPFARIAVGIGRPEERDAHTVSKFVLAPISKGQRSHLEEQSSLDTLKCLMDLKEEWDSLQTKG